MLKMNYIVQPEKEKREDFYNYLVNNNYKVDYFSKDEIINSPFPFTVDTKHKVTTLLKSITCCAMASQSKKIITVEEFIAQTQ